MNHKMRENGLLPFRIVLDVLSRRPVLNFNLSEQRERLESMKTVQAEMNATVAKRRSYEALIRSIKFLRTILIHWARKLSPIQNQNEKGLDRFW